MQIRYELAQLIDQEKKFQNIARMNHKFFSTNKGKSMLDEWINDVGIFSSRYLKNHPIFDRINYIIFHHNKDAVSSLATCLRSVYKDTTFWNENYQEEIGLEYYEELLSKILLNIDYSHPVVQNFLILPEFGASFEKLKSEGLITDFRLFGKNYCSFTVTYDGLHYFDGKARDKNEMPMSTRKQFKYDVFLSHASKDKLDYVEDLKASLNKLGISVFYDKDTMKWGNKWKEKILDGVEKSEFAIIVISNNFFGREWTEKELNEFLKRQNSSGQEIILPILHNITLIQLEEQYPDIAEIQTISSNEHSKDEIALLFAGRLIERLKSR